MANRTVWSSFLLCKGKCNRPEYEIQQYRRLFFSGMNNIEAIWYFTYMCGKFPGIPETMRKTITYPVGFEEVHIGTIWLKYFPWIGLNVMTSFRPSPQTRSLNQRHRNNFLHFMNGTKINVIIDRTLFVNHSAFSLKIDFLRMISLAGITLQFSILSRSSP